MYLFYRSVRLRPGSAHEQLAWANAMTEKVNQIIEQPAQLWAPFASPAANSLAWTVDVENLAVLETMTDKLLADSGYHMLLEQGSHHVAEGSVDDGLYQLLYADPNTLRTPAYASSVEAVIMPGQSRRAIEVGMEIAQHASRTTGVPISFSIGMTGVYGRVSWSGGYSSIQELERANDALQADSTFGEYLDTAAAEVFQPTGTTQLLFRRLA